MGPTFLFRGLRFLFVFQISSSPQIRAVGHWLAAFLTQHRGRGPDCLSANVKTVGEAPPPSTPPHTHTHTQGGGNNLPFLLFLARAPLWTAGHLDEWTNFCCCPIWCRVKEWSRPGTMRGEVRWGGSGEKWSIIYEVVVGNTITTTLFYYCVKVVFF